MDDCDRGDKFTERARKVLSFAVEEAQRFNHNYIGTEHLLLGLVREGEGVAAKVLSNLGVELNKVRSAVEFIIGRGDRIVLGEIGLTPLAKKAIELAVDEARRLNHHYLGTEHLLLGLVREGEGIAAGVLESLGINLDKVRTETLRVLSTPIATPNLKEAIHALEAAITEKEAAVQEGEYELAAEWRAREVELRNHIAKLKSGGQKEQDNAAPIVSEDDNAPLPLRPSEGVLPGAIEQVVGRGRHLLASAPGPMPADHGRKTDEAAPASPPSIVPPTTHHPIKSKLAPVLGPFQARFEDLLRQGERLPSNQRYTAHKIFTLLQAEGYQGRESDVRHAVSVWKRAQHGPEVSLDVELDPGQDALPPPGTPTTIPPPGASPDTTEPATTPAPVPIFRRLWRSFARVIIGGMVVAFVVELSLEGNSTILQPSEWLVVRFALAHPFWIIAGVSLATLLDLPYTRVKDVVARYQQVLRSRWEGFWKTLALRILTWLIPVSKNATRLSEDDKPVLALSVAREELYSMLRVADNSEERGEADNDLRMLEEQFQKPLDRITWRLWAEIEVYKKQDLKRTTGQRLQEGAATLVFFTSTAIVIFDHVSLSLHPQLSSPATIAESVALTLLGTCLFSLIVKKTADFLTGRINSNWWRDPTNWWLAPLIFLKWLVDECWLDKAKPVENSAALLVITRTYKHEPARLLFLCLVSITVALFAPFPPLVTSFLS